MQTATIRQLVNLVKTFKAVQRDLNGTELGPLSNDVFRSLQRLLGRAYVMKEASTMLLIPDDSVRRVIEEKVEKLADQIVFMEAPKKHSADPFLRICYCPSCGREKPKMEGTICNMEICKFCECVLKPSVSLNPDGKLYAKLSGIASSLV